MTGRHTVNLIPANTYHRDAYGILLESETEHYFVGSGIHNRNHSHRLDVWENRVRPDYAGQAEAYVDPNGGFTAETHSFLWAAQASMISASPRPLPAKGATLRVGDVVTLKVSGYPVGDFQIRAGSLRDPHMVEVDTASPASRQHFIETGEYLAPGDRS